LGGKIDLKLWTGILAGPAAWIAQLGVMYPIAQLTCHSGFPPQHPGTLHAISVGALIAIALAAWLPLQVRNGSAEPRIRFMANWGLLTCAVFALVVIATWIPPFILHNCEV
jgi:hypothetical protein